MKAFLAGTLLMAMGCAAVPAAEGSGEEKVPVNGGGSCDASKAQGLVGRERSEAVGAEAKRLTGAAALRWIPEGAMVTMDYREDRVNLELDSRGRIAKVRCG